MAWRTRIDLTDKRFGKWTVLKPVAQGQNGMTWLCRCDCGKEKVVPGRYLRKGVSTSCGCYAKEFQRQRITEDPIWVQNCRKPTTGSTRYVVEKDGKKLTLAEWAEIIDISLPVLINRWNRGVPDEHLLDPTLKQRKEKFRIPDRLIQKEGD
jgi:hypothetical protein